MFVLSSIALFVYTAGTRQNTSRELVIPPGTAELIAQGSNPLAIPPSWDFIAGDELALVNNDDVEHWIGQWRVPASGETIVTLQPVYAGVLLCSVHPDGNIAIRVEPSGYDWRIAAFPALLLGLPLGTVVVGSGWVVRALNDEEDE